MPVKEQLVVGSHPSFRRFTYHVPGPTVAKPGVPDLESPVVSNLIVPVVNPERIIWAALLVKSPQFGETEIVRFEYAEVSSCENP
jgi:hypothetical protein